MTPNLVELWLKYAQERNDSADTIFKIPPQNACRLPEKIEPITFPFQE
jgi:hypothetical protein